MRPLEVAQVVAGIIAASRLARGARRDPPLAPHVGPVTTTVSVVIPARNEADRIGPCLRALAADPQVHELIVVDDESSDATALIATSAGAKVIRGRPLPPGWVGKSWALQQGLQAATGEWLLSLDADVIPHPGLIGALVDEADRWDLLTAGVRFVSRTRTQRWLHASMLSSLVYRFGPPGAAPGRVMANGQCLLARREWLSENGGFAATGGHMTEDVALARWLAGTGARVGFVDGTRIADVEMHRDAGEVWREWGRSLAMPDVTTPVDGITDLALVWLAMGAPVLKLAIGRATRVDAGLMAMRLALAVALRGAYDRPVLGSVLADPLTAFRLTTGTIAPTRTWRGRTYPPLR